MSLRDAPLLYVFLDIHGLDAERTTLESVLGLPVVEVEPHLPHERHGVVKYDAGRLILSLNLSTPGKFRAGRSDSLVTVLALDPARAADSRLGRWGRVDERSGERLYTDPSGHHLLLRPVAGASTPVVEELQLTVERLPTSVSFYRDVMGLAPLELSGRAARFATGSVPLVLVEADRAADGRALHRRTCLLVFHTPDIGAARARLSARGLAFANLRAYFSDIGGTIRFEDPSGHIFCLYEPSAESLSWGSGAKVLDIVGGPAPA